jgi:hypothetical protein
MARFAELTSPIGREYIPGVVKRGDSSAGAGIRGVPGKANSYPFNGESFSVRRASFTGAEEPYDMLKRALRAEIDEAAWSCLYSPTGRPFNKPGTGHLAVKVINHHGDEVLKVFEI